MTPLDRGSLIHDALDRFLKEDLKGSGPWGDSDRARMAAIGAEVCADYEARGLSGRAVYWTADRRRILADLDRFVAEDNARGHGSGLHPRGVEIGFEDVGLDLPDGRTLLFRGRIDRVDSDGAGRLQVIDYKTGRADSYRRLDRSDPGGGGAHLQLAIYALAARAIQEVAAPIAAYYWMVSSLGGWGLYGYEVTDEVLLRISQTVGAIVEGIDAGVFVNHPTRSSTSPWPNCAYCDVDGLGEADLRKAWERKREDPAITGYRRLVEPSDG